MPFAVRNRDREVSAFVLRDGYRLFEIGQEFLERGFPHVIGYFRYISRPVASGPLWRFPFRIKRITKDVLLGEAHVLEFFPNGVESFGRPLVAKLWCDLAQRGIR